MRVFTSVVILVWEKLYEIQLVLKAFTRQDYSLDRFEIVIVDDGSSESLSSVIDNYRHILNITYIRTAHTGNRSNNRNLAVDNTRGDVLVFLDGDMIPGKRFLSRLVGRVEYAPDAVCLGTRKRLLPFDRALLTQKTIEADSDTLESLLHLNDERTEILEGCRDNDARLRRWVWQLFYSHSFCLWKSAYQLIGGFDPAFNENWGAEDIDLGYRLFLAGYDIVIDDQVISYHIHHDEDVLDKERQLQHNYDLLFRKHRSWEVELFIKEKELNFSLKKNLWEKMIKEEYAVKQLPSSLRRHDILPKTVVFGIESQDLVDHKNIDAVYLPTVDSRDEKVEHTIGIQTPYPRGHFNLALVSYNYRKVNDGLFLLVVREAKRISKEVILVDEETAAPEQQLNHIGRLERHQRVLFQLSGARDDLTSYFFTNLARSLNTIGARAELYYPWYSDKRRPGTLFPTKHESKRAELSVLAKNDIAFLGYEVLNVIDPFLIEYNVYPYENRLFWGRAQDYDSAHYPRGLFFDSPEGEKTEQNTTTLQIGVDREKIERTLENRRHREDCFTFLYLVPFMNGHDNLESLLRVFQDAFSRDPKARLKIIQVNYNDSLYSSDLLGATYLEKINASKRFDFKTYNARFSELKYKYRAQPGISFLDDVIFDEDITHEIHQCDCLLSLDTVKRVNPFVLESLCLGKRPVVSNTASYDAYFDDQSCFDLNDSHSFSRASKNEIPLNPLLYRMLNRIYANPRTVYLHENESKLFLDTFDWTSVAGKFLLRITNE